MPTGIEWTDETWNPITGCSRVSPGCDNCYAERQAATRLRNVPAYRLLTGPTGRWTGRINILEDRFDQPLRWTRPRRVFVNSMSDLFHRDVPARVIVRIFAVMAAAPRHSFQVLTKRPQIMSAIVGDRDFESWVREELAKIDPEARPAWPLPNVWLGTSIESQAYAFRAGRLLEVPAAVRFVSAEPLLGPLDLGPYLEAGDHHTSSDGPEWLPGLDWVIVGGESGPQARPMHPAWARQLRDQCVEAGVAFLFKQWGEYAPLKAGAHAVDLTLCNDGHVAQKGDRQMWVYGREPVSMHRYGKHAAGRELDGRTWDEYPQLQPA